MIKVQVGETEKIDVELKKEGFFLNGRVFDGEIVKLDESSYKVYTSNTIFCIDVVEKNGKKMKCKVNGLFLDVSVIDHMDQLLDQLGMNATAPTVVKEVKAPMPGSILNVIVSEGDEVNAGDPLLVLEAMKMENVIKSSDEGKVKKILVSEKENVEKHQVLVLFE